MMLTRTSVVLAVGLVIGAAAQVVSVTPSAFSTQFSSQPTGLSWANPPGTPEANSQNYAGTSLQATGGSGVTSTTPYAWTIAIDGVTVEACSASKCTTPAYTLSNTASSVGQIDASGDATGTNTTVVYNAPPDFPVDTAITICATDPGSHSGCATATIPTGPYGAEWVRYRAGMLGTNSLPWSIWSLGTSPATYQSSMAIWPNPYIPGTYYGVAQTTGSGDSTTAHPGIAFPVTAGTLINRPAFSYDGRWINFQNSQCFPTLECPLPAQVTWLQHLDSSAFQTNYSSSGLWQTWTWDVNAPSLMLYTDWTAPTANLWMVNLDTAPSSPVQVASVTSTVLGCGGAVCQPKLTSNMGGADNARNFVQEVNYSACTPNAGCPGGDGPILNVYDFGACETSLTLNCASRVSQWSINLGLGTFVSGTFGNCPNSPYASTSPYFDANGNEHQVQCEAGVHDHYYIRGQNKMMFNYGSAGDVGESLWFTANDDGTGAQVWSPAPSTQINHSFWSHPAPNASGNLWTFGGARYCNVSANLCTDGSAGIGFTDIRGIDTAGCTTAPTYPACGLYQFVANQPYGHGTWDGFDPFHVGHDNGGHNVIGGTLHNAFYESFVGSLANYETETLVWDFGNRPESNDPDTPQATSWLLGPIQSPDATKLGLVQPTSQSPADAQEGWIWYIRFPRAPVNVKLASSSAATLNWTAAALNHEAKTYWVWKQPGESGAWIRLNSVAAVYRQQTPYAFTDGALGNGQSACYGLTTQEWTRDSSNVLSNQVCVTNTAGVFTVNATRPAGEVNFDGAPSAATGLSGTQETVCALDCASGNIPTAPSVTAGTGGSLAAGSWQTKITYFKNADFPLGVSTSNQTLPSAAASTTVSASGTLAVNGSAAEMVGQDGFCVYDSGPSDSGTFWLDGCFRNPDPTNGGANTFGSAFVVTISSHNTSGSNPPVSNTTIGGEMLAWTPPAQTSNLWFALVLRSYGAPPSASNPWLSEIAAVNPAVGQFYDGFPSQAKLATGTAAYYGIVEMDDNGLLSGCVAWNAKTAAPVACGN